MQYRDLWSMCVCHSLISKVVTFYTLPFRRVTLSPCCSCCQSVSMSTLVFMTLLRWRLYTWLSSVATRWLSAIWYIHTPVYINSGTSILVYLCSICFEKATCWPGWSNMWPFKHLCVYVNSWWLRIQVQKQKAKCRKEMCKDGWIGSHRYLEIELWI